MTFFIPGNPEEEGGFPEGPPPAPDGTIAKHHSVDIQKAEFVQTDSGYRLDLKFYDHYYRQTQNAVYSRSTNPTSTGGKLQSPSQLPSYTIRLLKKTVPTGGVSDYNNIRSLWQPYSSFNTQNLINADIDFDAYGYGVGITPYSFWFPSESQQYSSIAQVDPTDGTGVFDFSLDLNGGVKYNNSPSFTNNFPSGPNDDYGMPSETTPIQQFIAGKHSSTWQLSFGSSEYHVLPRWKYCRAYNEESLFTEPGAYLIAITRNAIDNSFIESGFLSSTPGNPIFWSVNLDNSNPNVSLAYLIIDPPPLSPITIVNDILSFEVPSYGSVSPTDPTSSSGPFRFALRNKDGDTPTFIVSSSNTPLSQSRLTYEPTDKNQASTSITVKTTKNDVVDSQPGSNVIPVNGVFAYDFRLASEPSLGFMPYATTTTADGYVNYPPPIFGVSSIAANLKPNFSADWIPRIRSQVPQLTFSNSKSFGTSETITKYTEVFQVNPYVPPDGPIIGYSPVIINEAKFTPSGFGSHYLDLTFTDPHYKNTQRAVYSMSMEAEGTGELQAPSQLPPYIVRVFKKTAPSGGISTSNKIQSLWQPYGSFNTKTFTTGDSETFENNNIGAGITPYYYYFTGETMSYEHIGQVDATGGTGTVSIRIDKNGGMQYSNPVSNIGNDPYYSSTHSGNNVSNALPFQQVVASSVGNTSVPGTQMIYSPSYRYCAPLNTGQLFDEPGAYLVVVMRNAIESSFFPVGRAFRGIPSFWDVDGNASFTRPSLSSAFLTIDPPAPALYQTADNGSSNYNTLKFTVEGYGSVNRVENIGSSEYRWAVTNMFAGTPGFNTPKLPYDISSLSYQTPQGAYGDISFEPSDREKAYEKLETKTDIDTLRIAEQSVSSFEVRGAFLYDFRVTDGYDPYFNPYSDQAALQGYINYTLSTNADSKLQPNFGGWISKLRGPNNNLSISDSATFVTHSSAGQPRDLSEVENYYVTTSNYITLQASIDIPVQLNASIVEVTQNGSSLGYAVNLSWTETQSSIITSNIVGSGHVIRIYKRSNTGYAYEGSEFTSNPVAGFKYNSITDTGASVPTTAVTSTNGNNKDYAIRAGEMSLYTGEASETQTYLTKQEMFGGWMIVLQRNFTPAGAATPTLVTSCAVVTLPNSPPPSTPPPLISVVPNDYGWPSVLKTSILGIPLQNITSSFVNIHWSKQVGSNDNYQSIPPGPNYTQEVDTLGPLSVNVKCSVDMTFRLNTDRVVETLGDGTRLTIYDPNFHNSGYTGPRAIDQASAYNYDAESSDVDVEVPDISQRPIVVVNHEIAGNSTSDKKYLFRLNWNETLQGGLTNNFVNAKNVLRIFKYENNTGSYTFTPVSYAKYNNQYDTGINLLNAYTNYGLSEPVGNGQRDIYVDKSGNVSTSADNLAGNGFSEDEMDGNWLFILQRNFSTTNNLLLVTQGCYYIQLPPPSLSLVIEGSTEKLVTSPVDMFPTHTQNEWFAGVIVAPNPTIFGQIGVRTEDGSEPINDLESYSTLPLISESQGEVALDTYWPFDNGPSEIKNKVTIENLIGVNSSSYLETLGPLGEITTTDIGYFVSDTETDSVSISGLGTDRPIEYKYEGTTNIMHIYKPEQTKFPEYYLKNVSYSYKQVEGNNTYIEVLFTDPNPSALDENEAYIVNIFEKGSGSDAESQWSSHPKLGLAGEIITKNEVTIANEANETSDNGKLAIRIFANAVGDDSKRTQIINQTVPMPEPTGSIDSFGPGAYLIVIRRTSGSANVLPFYSINSGFVFIAPTPTDLTLSDTLDSTTPIYGSYDSSNNPNVTVTSFVTLEGVEEPEPFAISSSMVPTTIGISDDIIKINIDEDALKTAYPDSGPIVTAVRVTYDWSAPSSFNLSIGKINSEFNNVPIVPTTQTISDGITVSANQAVSNDVRILMPSNNYWNYEQGNIVRDARADFIGDANNRLLAVRWEDVKSSDLKLGSLAYTLRLYKKQATGDTASDQWAQVQYLDDLAVEATYLPESSLPSNALTKSIMYIYVDRDGHIWYNEPPPKVQTEDASRYHPFTDADDSGGYVLVIQRDFELTFEQISGSVTKSFISTVGTYLHLMPVVSWALKEQGTDLVSQPNPEYTTYKPGYTAGNGEADITYSWNLALPNIGYSNLIPGETSDRFDIDTFKAEFRNRDKSAVITSKVTYNFSVTELPFMEAYPLTYIGGTGFFTATSQDFIVDLCVKPTEFPPPPWPRFSLPCPDVTPEERAALQMRRKAETLMHVSNKHERRMTKAQQYSFIARGFNQKRQTYATQTDNYTNPNTKGYPVLGGGSGLALPSECGQRVLTFPSSASDVPGPVVPLTYDPNVPLINYKVVRTYNNSQTEYYDDKGL